MECLCLSIHMSRMLADVSLIPHTPVHLAVRIPRATLSGQMEARFFFCACMISVFHCLPEIDSIG